MSRLLDVLREACALTGTKEGCGEGECGACTVLINREAVCSCLVPAAQAEGASITTIEGLGPDHAMARAFMDEVGAQCGICTPGMIMTAVSSGQSRAWHGSARGSREISAVAPATKRFYRAVRKAT
jgi:aerobic-type carbon monoxide dehydrogenase small subunit (CoxS/CutS family)